MTERVSYHGRPLEVAGDNTYRSERRAMAAAKRLAREDVSVVMVVVSGTYRSTTQVWPTVGPTYSN